MIPLTLAGPRESFQSYAETFVSLRSEITMHQLKVQHSKCAESQAVTSLFSLSSIDNVSGHFPKLPLHLQPTRTKDPHPFFEQLCLV